jgi:putative alpha-1,2-mannosidase
MAIISDTSNHMILAVRMERGPGRDARHFKKILQKLPDDLVVKSVAADAGYDSEANQRLARQARNIRMIIPPKIGKPTNKLPKGKYRRKMKLHWDSKSYGQRW